MIFWWLMITICTFFIGYMMGTTRGVRPEHAHKFKQQAVQEKVRSRPSKGLHLVKEEKTRE